METKAPAWPKIEALEKFKQVGPRQYEACCPVIAHGDRTPSLSIGLGDDGCILLTCHRDCNIKEIVRALGCEESDLFPPPAPGRKQPPRTTNYELRDADGALLATHVRKDFLDAEGKPDKKVWWEPKGIRTPDMPLWRLRELLNAPADAPVYVCEGEKAADAAHAAGLLAVGTVTGASGLPCDANLRPLMGHPVILWRDEDDPGRKHMERIAERLIAMGQPAERIQWIDWRAAPPKGDAADYFARGGSVEGLQQLVTNYVEPKEPKEPKDRSERGPTIASLLVAQARAGAILFHDADGDAWATFTTPGDTTIPAHRETWPLASRAFRRWLARGHFLATGAIPAPQMVTDAIGTLEGFAAFDGPEQAVYTRIAPDPQAPGTALYLDLGDATWRAVHVTTQGWTVVDAPPVAFRRARGMLAIPVPARDGSLGALRAFTNVRDEDAWRLVVAWLVAALRPTGPYPVLSLTGEQGAAKTTLARLLRALVDPNKAPVRAAPRDERDLAIAATNAWTLTLDNLDSVPTWLSNALCRLSTGGGFATRTLYENTEETIFTAQRPIILTGIEEVTTRGDLVDRALLINLEAIPDDKRRTERALWADFEMQRPAILGALLNVVAGALRDLPAIHLEGSPRMADFAEWASAAEGALVWERGSFMRAYQENRRDANAITLDASPVAGAVTALLDDTHAAPDGKWEGKSSELLALLTERMKKESEQVTLSPAWPKTAKALTGILKRLAPNLRRTGVESSQSRNRAGSARVWTLIRVESTPKAGENVSDASDVSDHLSTQGRNADSIGSAPSDTSRNSSDTSSDTFWWSHENVSDDVSDAQAARAAESDTSDSSDTSLRAKYPGWRTDVLALAQAASWPAVRPSPAVTIAAGEYAWRTFVAGSHEGDVLEQTCVVLRRLAQVGAPTPA